MSSCARCQSMLAAMVRSEPDVAPVPQRSSRWTLAWLIPVAAAAGIIVWLAIPGQNTFISPPAAPAAPNASVAETAAPSTKPVPAEPPPTAASGVAPPAQAPKAAPTEAPIAMDRLSNKAVAPAATPVPQSKAEAAQRAEGGTREVARGAGGIPSGAIAGLPAAPPPVGRPVPSVEFRWAGGTVRWRISGSLVSRSTDAGTTWSPVVTGIDAQWTAGSAPADATCWLVGKSGAVAITTDIRTWRRLTAPAPSDLVSVQADDEKTATVTTADGRRFRTTDGGFTWTRLQEIPAAPFYE